LKHHSTKKRKRLYFHSNLSQSYSCQGPTSVLVDLM